MLRETSIVYSSLPQEEGRGGGGGSGSNNRSNKPDFVTTYSKNPHSRRDCQLTWLIMALVIICGVTLAVLLPLALKNKVDASGPREVETDQITTPNSIVNNGSDIQGNTPDGNSSEKHTGDDAVGGNNNKDTPDESGHPLPSQIMTTTTKETPTVRLTTPKLVSKVVTTTPFPLPVTLPKPVITITYPIRPTVPVQPFKQVTVENNESSTEDDREDSSGKTKEDNSSDNVGVMAEKEGNTGNKGENEDGIYTTENGPSNILGQSEVSTEIDETKDELLNDIYGKDDFSVKPSSTKSFSGWMNEIMSGHDQSTLVVLVVLVAVAAAMVVAAVAWVIQRRLASRRRRINIQSVITDLQSNDKVVLLNSEDSDEEQ